jgi:VWFA-related protein
MARYIENVFCSAQFGNLLLTALLLGQSAPPIRVPVRLVVAPTLVLSPTGQVISGLDADKFNLLDNGRSQQFRLDVEPEPLSVVIAIQANNAVSDYLPFVAKTGSVVENLLLGANGKAAVLSYSDDVKLVRTFDSGDVRDAFTKLSTSGQDAHMLDATERGIQLLKGQPASRARVLLLIGQSYDKGSTETLAKVTRDATAENVQIYALILPLAGKKFVADTFHFPNMASQGGGLGVGVELTSLIPTLLRGAKSSHGGDPFAELAIATGGTQIHFRKQAQLENALIVMGTELRSTYSLSYTPSSTELGYHSIRVVVKVPGAITYSRAGYESKDRNSRGWCGSITQ